MSVANDQIRRRSPVAVNGAARPTLFDINKRRISADNRTIVLCANTSWYLWNFRLPLARALVKRGCRVIFLAPRDDYSERLQEVAQFIPLSLDRQGTNIFREALAVFRIARVLAKEKADIVMSWTPKSNIYCAFASRVTGTRVVANVSGLGFAFIEEGLLARVVSALYKISFRKCHTVFFQNKEDMAHFIRSNWVDPGVAIFVPGSGVDLKRFAPIPPNTRAIVEFLFAGRLLSDKGFDDLIEARKVLDSQGIQVRIHVVGFIDEGNPSGISQAKIDQLVADRLIVFGGPSDRVEEHIANADCVVLPSVYREGVPRILLEAAACARPAITTNLPGCRDAVKDGVSGFLCEPRNVPSLVNAMKKMIALSFHDRARMGNAARRMAEDKFSEDLVLGAYFDVLNDRRLSDVKQ